jgi:DNA polymerase III gamma/tau subunit
MNETNKNWEIEFDEKLSKSIAEMLDYGSETKDFHQKLLSFIKNTIIPAEVAKEAEKWRVAVGYNIEDVESIERILAARKALK